ncbi:hypothetical protein AeNC1_007526 [Aphanomyces euteiches]|nr:hypothetical protein AeNC1_007526 [Aphanomyces euteiches]
MTAEAATRVFHAPELLQTIWSFQNGTHQDLLPFYALSNPSLNHRVPDFTLPFHQFEENDRVLAPWYATYNLTRLDRLFEHIQHAKPIVLSHAAFFGLKHVIEAIAASKYLPAVMAVDSLVDIAAARGDTDLLDFLGQYHRGYTKHTLRLAAYYGQRHVLERFLPYSNLFSAQVMDSAAAGGQLELIQWFHETQMSGFTASVMDKAASNGHLHVVQWLHTHRDELCSIRSVAGAASNGNEHVVRYLFDHQLVSTCPTYGVDLAAGNGHLNVVKYFTEVRPLKCTRLAMDLAARNGHLPVVRYLHEHRSEGCTVDAIDKAAAHGHADIVAFLTEHRKEGGTRRAMDRAAANGWLEVVKYLHEHRREGCTTSAMTMAALNGHLAVVQWLGENRREGCVTWTLTFAKDPAVVAYLRTLPPELIHEFHGLGLGRLLDEDDEEDDLSDA